ncbi:hypothetical protein LOTGIDRAFT_171599 [Lottia gigantea]|uniref:Uncharacterized protein n=1 Tax=Lottia gigantea TaxID=225164 RepID=V4BB51_LOTGI|nr:hypothetical protein LOTGIDRAFT_171599 [Lottia gigantea]ESP03252.1 hypothetical protein LOTGIDRAFT_171599 [Lottia gigantea]
MKPETLVMKIIEAVETDSPTVITFNGKKINITKKLIDKYKYCKVRDDIDLERIDTNVKKGGFIFSLPLIFAGITAAATVAGVTADGVKAVNAKKAAGAKAAEERRHNLKMEKLAKGSGVGEMIGTMKEFGKRFSEETKKTVKQGLNKLVDSIDTGEIKVKHKEIFPNNPMLMCICGSSGSGKTHLTFNMLTTPNLLDFDSLYIYTTTPEQSYYQFPKALEYLPKKDVQDLFQYYEENEEEVEIKDFIDNYIEGKKPTDIKVFLKKNVNDLDLSKIDSERKSLVVFDDCVVKLYKRVIEEDNYAEDNNSITQEIDEFEDMVSGQGITFLSDNNEELLNRLRVILAAMKEGHRSHRQFNEVNCILKRLLEKGIIDKNDYKSVIKNVK